MKRILFIGCVESSYFLLECLLQNDNRVAGIITMESSGENADFRSLVPLAEKYGISYTYTKNINDAETLAFARKIEPELIYCFGWSRLIGKEMLAIPKDGIVGFHPAALPQNRGRHPLIWALALGLPKTASTFFMMDEGADTGDIISQQEIVIDCEDTADSLYHKVLEAAKHQVLAFTEKFAEGTVVRVPQKAEEGNTWRKRGRLDGQIDWRMSGTAICNLVRALYHPYVGAHFMHGADEIKVWKCEVEPSADVQNLEPGKVLQVNTKNDYRIKAYDAVIHVLESDDVELREGDYLL